MSDLPAVTTAIARFDRYAERIDSGAVRPRAAPGASRSKVAQARRIATGIMVAVGLLFAAMIVSFVTSIPIGLGGLTIVVLAAVALAAGIMFWPAARVRPVAPYREEMGNKAVVQRLGEVLSRGKPMLPPAAAQKAEAIQAQLPLLESKLEALPALDPLAQDARRLMGQHLPELIERYEKVPAQYRRERDEEGMSVDDRLVSGLDAAKGAVDDLSRRLTEQDMDAFEVQGRFLESRYKDQGPGGA